MQLYQHIAIKILKYKRLAYLHTDFYKGKGVIKERSEELSYMWFGKIYSEEEINKEMEKYEKENKHPLRQLIKQLIKLQKINLFFSYTYPFIKIIKQADKC